MAWEAGAGWYAKDGVSVSGDPGSGGGGGGGLSVRCTWGGYLSGSGFYLDANSPTAGGVFPSINHDVVNVAPFAGELAEVALALEDPDLTQVWEVWTNDGGGTAHALAGTFNTDFDGAVLSGTVTLDPPIAVVKGGEIAIRLASGSPVSRASSVTALFTGPGGVAPGTLDHDDLLNVLEDQHHPRQHSVTSADDHTYPGGAAVFLNGEGEFVAPPAGALNHGDLLDVLPDQHHSRQHSVTSADDHTYPGGAAVFLNGEGEFVAPPGGGSAPASDSLAVMPFGGNMNVLGANYRRGEGAAGGTCDPDIDQLSAWPIPDVITLKYFDIATFRNDGTGEFGVFLGTSPTPIAIMDMTTAVPLPDGGHYMEVALPPVAVPGGSILTVRQTAGQTVEFTSSGLWFQAGNTAPLADDFAGDGPLLGYTTENEDALPLVGRAGGRYEATLTDNATNQTLWYNGDQGRFDGKLASTFDIAARNIGVGTVADSQVNPPTGQDAVLFCGLCIHEEDLTGDDWTFLVVGHKGAFENTVEGKTTNAGVSAINDLGPDGVTNTRQDLRLRRTEDGTISAFYQAAGTSPDNWIPYTLPGTQPAYGENVYVGIITYASGSNGVPFKGTCDGIEDLS